MYDIDEVFYNLMFDGHSLGWSVAGDKKTVNNIKRTDFVSYCDRFYQGSDMVLSVAGGAKEEEVKKLAEKYFSTFIKGEKEKITEFKENQTEPRLKIKHKQTDQCHLYLGYPCFSFFDEDKTALSILSAILGGGMSSRLFIEIRERRGLAYYIKAVSDLHHETGYFAARAGVNINKASEAVKVILSEFQKVLDGDIKENEVQKAKDYLKGHVSLDMEDSLEVALWYGRKQLLQGETETPLEVFNKIDKVSLDDVRRVAKRIIVQQKINLAMIGPVEDKGFLKIIS
jgi:predicted Zn-dependent peptidase